MIKLELLVIKLQRISSMNNCSSRLFCITVHILYFFGAIKENKFLYSIIVRKYNMSTIMRNNLSEGTIFGMRSS